MESKTPEIAFATTNLLPAQAATVGPEEVRDLARAMDYDNAEVTPTRLFMRKLGQLATAGEAVGSIHQTFARSIGRAAFDCATLQKGPIHLGVAVAMPERHGSLYDMHRIQHGLGRRLIGIVYGDYKIDGRSVHFNETDPQDPEEIQNEADFKEVLTQVHPELFGLWSTEEKPDTLLSSMLYKRGFTGICWSGFHVRRQSRVNEGAVLDVPRLLGDIREQRIAIPEVHFEIGRIDSVAPYDGDMLRTTNQELQAAISGPEAIAKTEIGEHMSRIFEIEQRRQAGSVPRVVVEVPARSLGVKNEDRFIGVSREIANHVREFSRKLVRSSL